MSWKQASVMDEKMKFVGECLAGGESMTTLCARYGISRQTGYMVKRRYAADGVCGLEERSRAPLATRLSDGGEVGGSAIGVAA